MTARYTVQHIDPPQPDALPADTMVGNVSEYMFQHHTAPVGITVDGQVAGVITYRSVSRALLIAERIGKQDSVLDLPVETGLDRSFTQVTPSDSLFNLFDILADARYVVATPADGPPRIIRDIDFHQFLQTELEEFLLAEEIEHSLRALFRDEMGSDLNERLHETFDQLDNLRTPDSLDYCSFRHYSIFFSDHWTTVKHIFYNNTHFVRDLINRVGDIRNQLFHFRDGDTAPDLDRDVLGFAREHFQAVQSHPEPNTQYSQ